MLKKIVLEIVLDWYYFFYWPCLIPFFNISFKLALTAQGLQTDSFFNAFNINYNLKNMTVVQRYLKNLEIKYIKALWNKHYGNFEVFLSSRNVF